VCVSVIEIVKTTKRKREREKEKEKERERTLKRYNTWVCGADRLLNCE